MQPLISVDHEMRHNAHRIENLSQSSQQSVREDTPLLSRFPPTEDERNPITNMIVVVLLIMLIVGVIIGVYLLILQSDSENILPPVQIPLMLVSRRQWDSDAKSPLLSLSHFEANRVIVVQTDTEPCASTAECIDLLKRLQSNVTSPDKLLPYNFLLSTDGQTYESLGWHKPSTLFPEYSNVMVLAFIGNYTEVSPSEIQMEETKNILAESISLRHLRPTFTLIGRSFKSYPTQLFECLQTFPQWKIELTDA